MTDRRDTILLQGIRLEGRTERSDEERSLPQPFEVDLVVEADLAGAARSDDAGRHGRLRSARGDLPAGGGDGAAIGCSSASREASRSGCWPVAGVLALHRASAQAGVPLDADLDFAQVEIQRTR